MRWTVNTMTISGRKVPRSANAPENSPNRAAASRAPAAEALAGPGFSLLLNIVVRDRRVPAYE